MHILTKKMDLRIKNDKITHTYYWSKRMENENINNYEKKK